MKATMIVILIALFLISISKEIVAQANRTISDQEVLNTANANLDKFREQLSFSYKSFGFPTLESLNNVKLGAPYEFVMLNLDFVNDTIFDEDKNYFYGINDTWDVPVLYDDTFRCVMSIFFRYDTLYYGSVGGAGYAKYFDDCERHYSIPKNGKRYFLWPEIIYSCEFIVLLDSTNNHRFYPLYYKTDDVNNSCLEHVSYNQHNSMKSFFETHRTQVYTSKNDIINISLEFEIYPNPLFNIGNLRGYIPPHTKEAHYKIYDDTGKELFKHQLTERGNFDIELDGTTFSKSGVYICKIILDGNSISKKIIVAK
jgi:hypothetical protein